MNRYQNIIFVSFDITIQYDHKDTLFCKITPEEIEYFAQWSWKKWTKYGKGRGADCSKYSKNISMIITKENVMYKTYYGSKYSNWLITYQHSKPGE